MDKYIQEIQNAIERAAIDGALTKDAVQQFNSLIEHNEALQDQAIDFDKKFRRQDGEIKELTTNLSMSQGLNKIAAEMEASLIERERSITKLEMTAANETKRVEDHKDMFDKVFRNLEVRRSVFIASPGSAGADQYGTALPAGYVEEREQKEKTE